ncbi:MAG: YraN family protein [Tenericutes bacterium HGW-Tenericutes-4]|nr:MAG: YraN family protein [Tenericutes bacterium HGW-Tenericutes-4]
MGKHLNKVTGNYGEQLAVRYLKKQKYEIIEQNFITKLGEIDIIAKENDTLVFIEVKTRKTAEFGLPREAVTKYKQNKIRQVATDYLKQNKSLNSLCRCDVIDILDDNITHIKNAF